MKIDKLIFSESHRHLPTAGGSDPLEYFFDETT